MSRESRNISFQVKPGPLLASWIGPVFFVGVAIWVAYMISRFDGDLGPNPPALFKAVFYGFISLGVLVPLLRAWSLWRRLPANIASGRMVIDDDGVLFDMGCDPVRIAWNQIAEVHPVAHRAGKLPSALFLTAYARGPLPQKEAAAVLQRIGGRWARVVSRNDGVVLPIFLLGLDEAANIENVIRARLTYDI